MLSTRRLFKR